MSVTGNVHRVSVDLSRPLAQEPQTGHNRWHPDIPPIVRAAAGDRVILQTRDALDGQVTPATTVEQIGSVNLDVVHPLTGPVFIDDAEPGDLLEVRIVDVEPASFGFTVQIPGFGFLRDEFPDPFLVRWRMADGYAVSEDLPGVRIPGASFPGTIGLAPSHALLAQITEREQNLISRGGFALPPSASGAVPTDPRVAAEALRTVPPRETAGNVDIKQLSRGCAAVAAGVGAGRPVLNRRRALCSGRWRVLRDGHRDVGHVPSRVRGAQGRGRAAQHSRRTVRARRVFAAPEIAAPRRFYATTGLSVTRDGQNMSEDATLAARNALLNMIDYLGQERGYTRQQAYALCSVAVDLKLSELVDVPNFVVSAFLPLDIFV